MYVDERRLEKLLDQAEHELEQRQKEYGQRIKRRLLCFVGIPVGLAVFIPATLVALHRLTWPVFGQALLLDCFLAIFLAAIVSILTPAPKYQRNEHGQWETCTADGRIISHQVTIGRSIQRMIDTQSPLRK